MSNESLAHELWAASQLTSGESITDGVVRILEILSQQAPSAVPECFAVTAEMIAAAEEIEDLYKRGTPDTWAKVFKAMLAAAPKERK